MTVTSTVTASSPPTSTVPKGNRLMEVISPDASPRPVPTVEPQLLVPKVAQAVIAMPLYGEVEAGVPSDIVFVTKRGVRCIPTP